MKSKDILLVNSTDPTANVSVHFQNGTFGLTQKAMAELSGVRVPAVSKHLKNIFETGELADVSTISKIETVQSEGQRSANVKLTVKS